MSSSEILLLGRWWSAVEPSRVYVSQLRVDRQGRSKLQQKVPDSVSRAPRVFGELPDGTKVTLVKCGVGGLGPLWDEVIIGAHVEDSEDIQIAEARAYFLKTHPQLNFESFSLVQVREDPGHKPEGWPTHPEVTLPNRFADPAIRLTISIENSNLWMLQTVEGLTAPILRETPGEPCAVIKVNGPVLFEEVKERVFEVQDFISFGMGQAAIVDRVEFVAVDGQRLTYYGQWHGSKYHAGGTALRHFLFSLDRVPLDQALRAWYWALDNLYPAPQVVTYRYYTPGFLEHDLSSAVSALENMHKQIKLQQKRSQSAPDGTEEIRALLRGQPESKARDKALRAVNAKPVPLTLVEKLKELADRLPNGVFEALGFSPEEWIEEAKPQRNMVSHTASHVTEQSTDAVESLRRGAARSRAILTLQIMREAGLPAEMLDEIIDGMWNGRQDTASQP